MYRAIAREANALAASGAASKVLLVYSNLYENAELNFYDPQTLNALQSDPASVERQLTESEPMNRLGGMKIWLIYEPASYEENGRYMTVAKFYKALLERRGATVYLGGKF